MNKKGFTLIELLAVIVLLGLVLAVTIPLISDSYRKSKLKSEEIFVKRLSEVIDEYIKLNSDDSDELVFTTSDQATKNNVNLAGNPEIVYIYGTTKTIDDIIGSGLLKSTDYINAGNKNVSCNKNAEIEIYKDSDGVYCHKIEKDALGCVTEESIDSIKVDDDYLVNTCVWYMS